MEVPLQRAARRCAVTDQPFLPGERRCTFLLRQLDGELLRVDVHRDQVAAYAPHAEVLARWEHTLPASAVEEAPSTRLQSAEEIVRELAEVAAKDPQAAALRYLAALVLERKRLLKPLGANRYRLGNKDGEIFTIQPVELTPAKLLPLEAQLDQLL